MRIPSITLHASLAGATASLESTIVSITSDTGDVDVRQLPKMMRNAGYPFDPEVASFLDTAEITTLEYVHSQVVQTPPHTIGSEALCSFVTSASSKLSLQSDCAEDASGDIFELDGELDVNDPDAKYQKHLGWMDMSQVWKLARPHVTRTVKAAVIDTGVDWTDPDFAPLKGTLAKKSGGSLAGGWNFFTQSTDQTTKEPHGTEVSKILAAKGNNLVGMAGVAPNVILVPLQIFAHPKYTKLSLLSEAINMAIDLGVDVITMAIGYYFSRLTTAQQHLVSSALRSAQLNGILFVSSAGNRGEKASDKYPCWCGGPLGICVANLDNDRSQNVLHPKSNWGEGVDVAAYGTRVFSGRDKNGKLRYFDGTSASAPIVGGLVAILLSMGVDPDLVKPLLLANVDQHAISMLPLSSSELRSDDGFGLGD
ncbi:hypothetical protein FOZ61_006692 [Perkinsus olseni]|uniref:subtilisin n=1 Tax=Perkinsus olseni TaxID=32597 RepID=A0A7J6M8H0_PEROL|nr:hypothetical protein FOL46_002518 [Perkinsus olseni]KAF4668290.1 hypothetical protein FOZ61_006692 [Perkinsus olseni]